MLKVIIRSLKNKKIIKMLKGLDFNQSSYLAQRVGNPPFAKEKKKLGLILEFFTYKML